MKREVSEKKAASRNDDMLPEYDFKNMAGGVRGKYYKEYREGHTVEIRNLDGRTTVQYFKIEEGAVMLESDIRKHFPDSEAVNRALRCLIPLVGAGRDG